MLAETFILYVLCISQFAGRTIHCTEDRNQARSETIRATETNQTQLELRGFTAMATAASLCYDSSSALYLIEYKEI